MNKKGFTLTELLAVIVILSVVMLIGSTSISAVQNKINKSMFASKLEFVISAAKSYGQDNKEEIRDSEVTKTVGQLLASGYLESDETAEYPGCDSYFVSEKCVVLINNFNDKIVNSIKVKIYLSHNRVYACIDKSQNDESLFEDYDDYEHLNYYCN